MSVEIRRMSAQDKSAIMLILRNTPEFKSYEVKVAEEVIDSYLHDTEKSGYDILVAENDANILGYICYGPTPCTEGTWDIYWEAVAREKRGQGIGAALIKTAESAIRKAHGRMIIIETSSTPIYESTRRFYFSRGYEEIGRIPDFYTPGDDQLILQKRLK